MLESGAQGRRSAEMVRTGRGSISTGWHASPDGPSFSRGTKRSFSSTLLRLWPGSGCLRCLLLVMCTYPFAKKALTLHLARGEGRERYFGCNLMQRKVLASSHQHLIAEAPSECRVGWFLRISRTPLGFELSGSVPFEPGEHGRAAVKIVDDRGVESLKIVELA